MSFFARAGIALLAGVGAGTIGFGTAYLMVEQILLANPGVGHDGWLLFAIFGPGMGAAGRVSLFEPACGRCSGVGGGVTMLGRACIMLSVSLPSAEFVFA